MVQSNQSQFDDPVESTEVIQFNISIASQQEMHTLLLKTQRVNKTVK